MLTTLRGVNSLDRLGTTTRWTPRWPRCSWSSGWCRRSRSRSPTAAVGELFVLGTTLPLAWRRTRPVESALVASAFWLVPLDGYPVLGFVVVILQFFALGSHGEPRRAVAAVDRVGVGRRPWSGRCSGPRRRWPRSARVLVVVAPVLAGRLVAPPARTRTTS